MSQIFSPHFLELLILKTEKYKTKTNLVSVGVTSWFWSRFEVDCQGLECVGYMRDEILYCGKEEEEYEI